MSSSDEEIAQPLSPMEEPMMIVTNVTSHTLRFTLLDDGMMSDANVPLVELDETRWVQGEHGTMVHPPKLFGPANAPHRQTTRQLREHRIEIKAKGRAKLARRFLYSLLHVRCELCVDPSATDQGGRCKHADDAEHRKAWKILSGALVSPEQVVIDILDGVPVDGLTREALEANAKAGPHNRWGRDLAEGRAAK